MNDRTVKLPGPDHPITIEKATARMIVTVAGETIADSTAALVLHEAAYPPVLYFPRGDVAMDRLARSERTSHCPYKGDASYFAIPAGGARSVDAVWSYESPYPAMAEIRGHVAFYPHRVDSIGPASSSTS